MNTRSSMTCVGAATVLAAAMLLLPACKKEDKPVLWRRLTVNLANVLSHRLGGQPAKDRASGGWGIPTLKSLHAQMPQGTALQKQAFEVQQQERHGEVPKAPPAAACS